MIRKAVAILCLLFPLLAVAQSAPEPVWSEAQSAPISSPEQLDNLVAPIALYPDQLLSEVLAAATYPLEVVEAQQWIRQQGNLSGPGLMDAARQQNWDPSVQALVAFPNVLSLLNRDIRWTTDLGNAFLSEQSDVMSAVQRMRARAQGNGRLQTAELRQVVTTETQDGQSAIQIQPADPQVIYVPAYNPVYVWGPPAWGVYPALQYPEVSAGFDWSAVAFIGNLFTGLLGWGGWGWGLNWFTHSLLLNPLFFTHFGFGDLGGGNGGFGGGGGRGPVVWAHNPSHRLGVPYSNHGLANRFHGGFGRGSFAAQGGWNRFGSRPAATGGWRNFGGGAPFRSGRSTNYASAGQGFRAFSAEHRAPLQGSRGFSHFGTERAAPAYRGAAMSRSGERASNRQFQRASPFQSSGHGFFSRSSHSSQPHFSSQHFSAARSPSHSFHSFGGRSFGGHSGGGHFGGGHSGGGHSGGGHSGGGHSHRR
jgi:hypothetical protein